MVVFPATLARAQGAPVPDRGAEVAVRTGLALPFGDLVEGASLDRYTSSAIPLVVEAGIRLDANLFLGGRFGYSFANVKSAACPANLSCDGSIVTLGLEGIYRFIPEQSFAPWVGAGLGYEWTSFDGSSQNLDVGSKWSGFQALLMAGGDLRINRQLVLGPALEASFGRFDTASTHMRLGNLNTSNETDITDTAWHTWITLGIRGAWGF